MDGLALSRRRGACAAWRILKMPAPKRPCWRLVRWPLLAELRRGLELELALARVDLGADRHRRHALDRHEPADRRLLGGARVGPAQTFAPFGSLMNTSPLTAVTCAFVPGDHRRVPGRQDVAGVADLVAVVVGLVGVGHLGAVVARVRDAVLVGVLGRLRSRPAAGGGGAVQVTLTWLERRSATLSDGDVGGLDDVGARPRRSCRPRVAIAVLAGLAGQRRAWRWGPRRR